jgi:ankyrin repeat protein
MHSNYEAVVAALLEAGAHPSLPDAQGFTPLHTSAVQHGNISSTRRLLAAGAQLEARTFEYGECEPFLVRRAACCWLLLLSVQRLQYY